MQFKNLTSRQIELLDKIWSIDCPYELNDWKKSLSDEDYRLSVALQELIIAECIDDAITDSDCAESMVFINKIKNKSD